MSQIRAAVSALSHPITGSLIQQQKQLLCFAFLAPEEKLEIFHSDGFIPTLQILLEILDIVAHKTKLRAINASITLATEMHARRKVTFSVYMLQDSSSRCVGNAYMYFFPLIW